MSRTIAVAVWAVLGCIVVIPLAIAASSPYLPSRNIAYIIASFAGIGCLGLFVFQPLLVAGYLPGSGLVQGRKWHRHIGSAILVGVSLHVGGLYLTSPPDTADALLFTSPTPFSIFGVLAMWGVVLTAFLVLLRKRLGLRYPKWQILHNVIVLVVVMSTAIHAVLIEGTMGTLSKWVLCAAAVILTCITMVDLRLIRPASSARRSANISAKPRN